MDTPFQQQIDDCTVEDRESSNDIIDNITYTDTDQELLNDAWSALESEIKWVMLKYDVTISAADFIVTKFITDTNEI